MKKDISFFDILGFKEMVENKYKDNPEIVKGILSTMHILSSPSYKAEMIIFSDSVINILNIKPGLNEYGQSFADYFNVVLDNIATIQTNMFTLYGVLIRGSIVSGDIYYKKEKNILFGPALIKAYELESKHSVYPRFIIDKSMMDLVEEHSWLNISEDLDGHYYLDIFKWLVKLEPEKHHLEKIKNKISIQIDNLGVNPNLSVLSKYKWFLNKIIERERTDLRKTRT